ncbi:MAG: glycoside hydrolase TIM-barrel-like domain-containing protein [Pseudomonadota bacterium]
MATLLLSAAGAAIGAGFGGTVIGLSGAVIGRAIGATLGRVIDQRLMGAGSDAVEVGRVDRLRLTSAGEGAAIAQVWGRMRVAGQIIWATQFQENRRRSGGGKGAPQPSSVQFSYSISLGIALCEGEITRVGRIWADGAEVSATSLNLRIYPGTEDQLADPKISAVEGAGMAPAYRGIAYVVIEDLDLSPYGNRVPQFTFEVLRRAKSALDSEPSDIAAAVRAVALVPGTGEYGLATTRVHYNLGRGISRSANVHSASGKTDFATSLDHLAEELPECGSVSLVVSWFGSDLRCGECTIAPKVEQNVYEGVGQIWRSGGLNRAQAELVPKSEGRSIYGGTPSDASVIEAIAALRARGQEVMFYPFILMDQLEGSGLPDPYLPGQEQPALPWRGRITVSIAPGRAGTPDRTAAAASEVAAFFGTATAGDFVVSGSQISYIGAPGFGYRRFILHYAHLCAAAGGVDAFCIGSEMRGLTQIRGALDSFPAVVALRQLAADVRGILGAAIKISYAADWTEYFGYQTDGNVYFHLDPLWADANIDFVGIDNYLPVADWRDGEDHADAGFVTIHNLAYLGANIAGGEGFDWYYDSPEGRAAQRRLPITDGAHGEPWVFRDKDLKSWWSNLHHERQGATRSALPTDWVPGSKPIRFTEYGCAAVDKGGNEPNKFVDLKSSESALPRYSNGRRDDLMQMQYYRAFAQHFADEANNPVSVLYGGPMVDMAHAHAWAWDARPFPEFPTLAETWSDGPNYTRGHWLNGRVSNQSLEAVVAEICSRSGMEILDARKLYGVVRGYLQSETGTARSVLQPLMLAYGFDALERDGKLRFEMRSGRAVSTLARDRLALASDLDGTFETTRTPEVEIAGRVRLGFVEAEGSYEIRQAEAIFPDEVSLGVSQSEMPLVLTTTEAQATVERWLSEARVARDTARFALPKSRLDLGAGDVVRVERALYRIDRVEQGDAQLVEAVRVEPGVYRISDGAEERILPRQFYAPVPVYPVFLDLPLLTGSEVAHAPHLAVTANPWPGTVAVWSSSEDAGYEVNRTVAAPSVIGVTQSPLAAAPPGVLDRGAPLRIKTTGGSLSASTLDGVLNGANVMAIGDGSADNWEVFQFVEAEIVAPDTYEVSLRLRGQVGTDGIMPPVWPTGSEVVLLDRTPQQIDLPLSARGLARYYRVGVAGRGFADPTVVTRVEAFEGIGLRPYPVAHLRAIRLPAGDLDVAWIRRTRIDGDSWLSPEVPLGEDSEAYAVRVRVGTTIVAETTVAAPFWTYSAAQQATNGATVPFRIEVAQVSDRFGPGPFRSLDILA